MKLFIYVQSAPHMLSREILDDAFGGAEWMSIWAEATALIDEVVSDNFKQCQVIYNAE